MTGPGLRVKVVRVPHPETEGLAPLPMPSYATALAAGADLRADIAAPLTLPPLGRMLVPTGLSIELPPGYEGQVRPRSGLALKQGITCLNSPGTIDADYRGEVKVLLVNLSDTAQVLERGDRIAQLVIARAEQADWISADSLGGTSRGSGGFGSTGR